MFGSKALALPPPFAHETRQHRLETEPVRPQPSGQCHFLTLQGAREQRCPCQGYQQNRGAPGNVCDCNHAACYHANAVIEERLALRDNGTGSGAGTSNLAERIRTLENTVRFEREIRENAMARERQAWEREIAILREALAPFYKTEQDMQRKLSELEDKLHASALEQTRLSDRMVMVESANLSLEDRMQGLPSSGTSADRRSNPAQISPHDASGMYSGSESRTSVSAESMSPKQVSHTLPEPESPRSSGILNLVEFPRPAAPRYVMPPRLSPPAELEEPRSSGFLALDVKEIVQRRSLTSTISSAQTHNSPRSSLTKSPPTVSGREVTPQSLPRVSPPHMYVRANGKKRKHQGELMALDVLADVSAASPVIS